MTSISDSVETMMENYRKILDEDPEFLLLDYESYLDLKEEVHGSEMHRMEIDVYRGMKVFRSDLQRRYIMML